MNTYVAEAIHCQIRPLGFSTFHRDPPKLKSHTLRTCPALGKKYLGSVRRPYQRAEARDVLPLFQSDEFARSSACGGYHFQTHQAGRLVKEPKNYPSAIWRHGEAVDKTPGRRTTDLFFLAGLDFADHDTGCLTARLLAKLEDRFSIRGPQDIAPDFAHPGLYEGGSLARLDVHEVEAATILPVQAQEKNGPTVW
jgi:hypothetical protein